MMSSAVHYNCTNKNFPLGLLQMERRLRMSRLLSASWINAFVPATVDRDRMERVDGDLETLTFVVCFLHSVCRSAVNLGYLNGIFHTNTTLVI